MLDTLEDRFSGHQIILLVRQGYEPADWVAAIEARGGWTVFKYTANTLACAIAEWKNLQGYGDQTPCVIIDFASVFVPNLLLDQLLQEHEAQRACLTLSVGFPQGATPLLLSNDLLTFACHAETLAGVGAIGYSSTSFLRKCAEMLSAVPGDHRRTICEFPTAGQMEVNPKIATPGIDPSSAKDLARLEDLTDRFTVAWDGTELLKAWRESREREVQELWIEPLLERTSVSCRPRVLFVANSSGYSGAAESLVRMIEAIPPDEYECFGLLGAEGHFASSLREISVDVAITHRDLVGASLTSARDICDCLARINPDVVHLNGYCGVLLPLISKLRDVRLIYHARNSTFTPEVLEAMSIMDCILSVSEHVRQRLRAAGIPKENIEVAYDGVDTDKHIPATFCERYAAKRFLSIPPERIVILLVARYDASKRQDLLLRAIAELPARDTIHTVLVGEAFTPADLVWEEQVRRLIVELGLEENSTKLSFLADIRAVQAAADISVLCSEEEALGTSVLEAMSMAIPVIVSDRGGLPELVGGLEPTGLIVKAGSKDGLKDALQALVANCPY